jgi:hypothetical protein
VLLLHRVHARGCPQDPTLDDDLRIQRLQRNLDVKKFKLIRLRLLPFYARFLNGLTQKLKSIIIVALQEIPSFHEGISAKLPNVHAVLDWFGIFRKSVLGQFHLNFPHSFIGMPCLSGQIRKCHLVPHV